jgi:16S rRNA (guanine527-N7)-methyltransferase
VDDNQLLIETLREAQRLGFFGDRPVEEAVTHAHQFVDPLRSIPSGGRIVDLGSGGGLPGLVVAAELGDHQIVLLDRRQKRTDFLSRGVSRLGFSHVEVWCRDASDVAASVCSGDLPVFAAVTARGFGPPIHTLRIASRCLGDTGRVVISEPPAGNRWPPDLLSELAFDVERLGSVAVFDRR